MTRQKQASSVLTLSLVFGMLIVLATASYGFSKLSLGPISVPVALTISGAKAVLVGAFFMELIHQKVVQRFVLATAAILVTVMIALVAADKLTRDPPPFRSEFGLIHH